MEKSINLKTEEFKNNLYFLINNSDIPVANAYLVFQQLEQELKELYIKTIQEETEQLRQQQKEEQEEQEENK